MADNEAKDAKARPAPWTYLVGGVAGSGRR